MQRTTASERWHRQAHLPGADEDTQGFDSSQGATASILRRVVE